MTVSNSDLDEKLKEIAYAIYIDGYDDTDLEEGMPKEIYVDEIKQAFTDAGYEKHDWSITPGSVQIDGKLHMTGAEWYDRFMLELKRESSLLTATKNPRKSGYAVDDFNIELAARRASGIDTIDYSGGNRG